ncbi:hypothetical protein PMAYCL1PPCAC_20990, partial [Pristionchus mayeri]
SRRRGSLSRRWHVVLRGGSLSGGWRRVRSPVLVGSILSRRCLSGSCGSRLLSTVLVGRPVGSRGGRLSVLRSGYGSSRGGSLRRGIRSGGGICYSSRLRGR